MITRQFYVSRGLQAFLLLGGMAAATGHAQAQTSAGAEAPIATQGAGPHPLPDQPVDVPRIPDTSGIVVPSVVPLSTKNGEKEIVASLKGLVLISNIDDLRRDGISDTGIVVRDLPMLDDPVVQNRLAAFLGKKVTQDSLREIDQIIITWYRDKQYPFVDVLAPAGQDITNGVVQVLVSETRRGKVTARGNKWFSSDFLISQVRLEPGDRINIQNLETDKNWINQNPFRLVNIVANRSDTPGETDLVVDTVEEKFPVRAYVGYSNDGQVALGHDRWSFGFTWGNALWHDDQFSYQITTSDDFWHSREKFAGKTDIPSFTGQTFSYELALPWRDKVTFYGSYLQSSPLLGPDIGLAGTDATAGIRYTRKLPSTRKFDEQFQVGYEFKTSNDNLEFGGFQVSNTTSEVDQFFLEYDATLRDDYGQTDLTNSFVFSPGGLTGLNNNAVFAAQTCGNPCTNGTAPSANYFYDHVVITRITGLPKGQDLANSLGWFGGVTSVTKLIGQVSSGNLIPSEQLGAGGVETVRGYDERAANGSEGIVLSQEFRTPTFSLARLFADTDTNSAWNDTTQLGIFYDYGSLSNNKTAAGSPVSTELDSWGLGFHLLSGPDQNVRIDLDYGFQLRKLPGEGNTSQFGTVSVILAN
jgi:hemolysin activation/secretion protein